MNGTEVLNISPIVVWVVALSQLLTFGLTIYGLMSSGARVNSKRLEDHAKRIDGHDLRLNTVEEAQRASPTKEDMQNIALSLEALRGDLRVLPVELKVLRAELQGSMAIRERLEAIVSRHENFLLKG